MNRSQKEQQRAAIQRYIQDAAAKMSVEPSVLAKRAGLAPSTINRFLNDPAYPHIPTLTTLGRISSASGMPLPPEIGGGSITKGVATSDIGERHPIRGRASGNLDLPVLGNSKAGTGGIFMDNGVVQSYVERPWFMMGVNNGYAVYVSDDCLGPLIKHGRLVYVDPSRPVAADDLVIIQLRDGQAFIKIFKGYKRGKLQAEQTNPQQIIEWPESDVESVHFVMSVLFGRT